MAEGDLKDAYAKGFLGKNIFAADTTSTSTGTAARALTKSEKNRRMESLEGKRGIPRNPASLPCRSRTLGRPTVINNPDDPGSGSSHHAGRRRVVCRSWHSENGGTRLFCLAGNLGKPGVSNCRWVTTSRR